MNKKNDDTLSQIPIDFPVSMKPGIGFFLLRFVVYFLTLGLITAIGMGLALLFTGGIREGLGMVLTGSSMIIGGIIAYYVVAQKLEGRTPKELHWKTLANFPLGILGGTLLVSVCVGTIYLLGGVSFAGMRAFSEVIWLEGIIMTGLAAGVVEEILFRGILFRYIEQSFGTWAAIIVSSVIFGLLHILSPSATLFTAIATVIEAGLLFGVIYTLSRSLWVVIGIHTAWNFVLSIIFGLPVSGNINAGLFNGSTKGADLISGGSYGPEASIISVLILTSVAVFVLVMAVKQGKMISQTQACAWIKQANSVAANK